MFESLEHAEARYEEIGRLLADPDVVADRRRYQDLAKEYSELEERVICFREYRSVQTDLREARELLETPDDPELRELAEMEVEELAERETGLEERLGVLLTPKDPNDDRNIIVEIRAGTGGEEAGLFVADLYRMYARYAERHGWKLESMNSNPTGIGGFKEIVFSISGGHVFRQLKYESGVHRVQRVPATESSGRIHTSATSISVLPEAEDVEVEIAPEDLRIDVCRSSGPGGQSVNTTDSAVRITHLPTSMVVQCQDEKSQHKNRAKAMKVLRARLLDRAQREQREQMAETKRSQVGSGDRSEKIRTYNFPQNRVTDHRIHLTLHRLTEVLEGDLDPVIEALQEADQTERMKNA